MADLGSRLANGDPRRSRTCTRPLGRACCPTCAGWCPTTRRAIDHLRRPRHVTVPIELVRDLADADGREAADSLVLAREMYGCLDRLPTEQRETLWIQRSRLQEEPSLDETVLGGQREGSLDDLTAQGQGATSMPARWTTADIPDQTGRTLLITGANAGIGYHQARELAAKGATVLLASRDLERGRAARDRIVAIAPGARVEVVALDLADLDSVQRLADQVLIRDEGFDVLVNNAGVMGVPDRQTTAQGIELQFGTNHLGHFALTGRLLPQCRKDCRWPG
jgi:short chain dehydrogenase